MLADQGVNVIFQGIGCSSAFTRGVQISQGVSLNLLSEYACDYLGGSDHGGCAYDLHPGGVGSAESISEGALQRSDVGNIYAYDCYRNELGQPEN